MLYRTERGSAGSNGAFKLEVQPGYDLPNCPSHSHLAQPGG
jgi:hypothetical protein